MKHISVTSMFKINTPLILGGNPLEIRGVFILDIEVWPENDIWGVLEWFGTLIRYLESSRSNFGKIEKNRIFWIFDLWVTTMSGSKFRPIGRKSAE